MPLSPSPLTWSAPGSARGWWRWRRGRLVIDDNDNDDTAVVLVAGRLHHHQSYGGSRRPRGRRGPRRPRVVGVGPHWRGSRLGSGGPGGPGAALAAVWVSHTIVL